MKIVHAFLAGVALTLLIALPVWGQIQSVKGKPIPLNIGEKTPAIQEATIFEAVKPKAEAEQGAVKSNGEDTEAQMEAVVPKEAVMDSAVCLKNAETNFINLRSISWQKRLEEVNAAWVAYTAKRQVAWDAYVSAKKPLDATYESSVKAARQAKNENAILAARTARETAHRTVLRNLQSERQAAHDAWVKARGEAIVAWQRSFRAANDQKLKEAALCKK
ncbi:hypothetical protein KBC59_01140 [Patescibacteria group bacterium]|jgi:hypothetical protein|nr:hypothetical protein [Patescibacteria group bacterium]